MESKGFDGKRVLSLESRRAKEIAQLIANNGGEPIVAPSNREIPSELSPAVASFVSDLLAGKIDAIIFMTGVGARHLAAAAETICSREKFVAALSRLPVIARGPKPVAALKELGISATFNVPEPNTWREILQVMDKQILDQNAANIPIKGKRVAVQEYGEPSTELLAGLAERGAEVIPVHVYDWAQPEDTGPLKKAVEALAGGAIDVVMFTSSIQLKHLLEVAADLKLRDEVLLALSKVVVASIGPSTSEALRKHNIKIDMEPSHPRMGFLVKEAAERGEELLRNKRANTEV